MYTYTHIIYVLYTYIYIYRERERSTHLRDGYGLAVVNPEACSGWKPSPCRDNLFPVNPRTTSTQCVKFGTMQRIFA